MPKLDRFRRKEKQVLADTVKLAPSAMEQTGKGVALLLAPMLVIFGVVLYMMQQKFSPFLIQLSFIVGVFVIWPCFIGLFYVSRKTAVIQKRHFHREHGFTPRIHPRYELLCEPQDIVAWINKDEKCKSKEEIQEHLKNLGVTDIKELEEFMKLFEDKTGKYCTFFRWKTPQDGFDIGRNEFFKFRSEVVFHDKPTSEQWNFSLGQDNWMDGIPYNHPASESDNVKVLFVSFDPVTHEPMPVCTLLHSSLDYTEENTEKKEEMKVVEVLTNLISKHEGIIKEHQQNNQRTLTLLKEKFHDVKDIRKWAREIAHMEEGMWYEALKDVGPGWWGRLGFSGKIATIILVGMILIFIAWLLQYIGVVQFKVW